MSSLPGLWHTDKTFISKIRTRIFANKRRVVGASSQSICFLASFLGVGTVHTTNFMRIFPFLILAFEKPPSDIIGSVVPQS